MRIYLKFLRLFLVLMIGVFFLLGSCCEEDKPISSTENLETIQGKVYVDSNKSATVTLYLSSDLNKSIISSKSLTDGSFKLEDVNIQKKEFYVIKSCFTSANEGCIESIIKGNTFSNQLIHIGYLNDMISNSFNESFTTKSSEEIESFLVKKAKDYCREDINGDGKIDYLDILSFKPAKNFSNLKINYEEIKSIYNTRLQNKTTKIEKLQQLLLVDKAKLNFSIGKQLSIGEEVNMVVDNLPNNIDVKFFMNKKEISSKYKPVVNGVHNIYSKLLFQKKFIGEVSESVVVSSQKELGQFETKTDEDSSFKIEYNTNSQLEGLEITVPKNALSDSKIITIKENNLSIIASSRGRSLSPVLNLEPSGTTFDSPVIVKLPFTGDLKKEDMNKVEIARYSKKSGLDYIKPIYIDFDKKFIYFETDHFSWFSAKGPFSSKSNAERKEEIDYLNSLTGNSWSETRWKSLLDPDNEKEYTLYDYFVEHYLSEKIYTKVEDSDYVGATKVLFPNNDALDDTVARWNRTKYALMALEVTMEKTVLIYDEAWWKFWQIWTVADTGKLHTMMGLSQDFVLDKKNDAYTPFAPVNMGDKIFKDFSKLLQNNTIKTAFAMADIDGGWNDVYVKPNKNYPDVENPSNQNIGVIYRRYDEYRKHGTENKESLKKMIEDRATFIDNMKNPYLSVHLDRVNGQHYNQFGKRIEVQASESIKIEVRVSGMGIANFDESDLKYELMGNYGKSNEFTINQDTTKNGLHFKLPSDIMYQNYTLIITHVPTSVTYDLVGINIQTIKAEFRLVSSSLLADETLYPSDKITLVFDKELKIDDQQRDYGWVSENIENSIYFKNKETNEKKSLYWHFGFQNCRPSSNSMKREECDTDFSVLEIFTEVDNNKYELIVEDTLLSKSGEVLSEKVVYSFNVLHPNKFKIDVGKTKTNSLSAIDYNFKMFNNYDTKKVTYRVITSAGKETTGSLFIGSATQGGPGSFGFGSCETYVHVDFSGTYKEGVVNFNNLEVTVGNTRDKDIQETISIEFCSEKGECKIFNRSVFY